MCCTLREGLSALCSVRVCSSPKRVTVTGVTCVIAMGVGSQTYINILVDKLHGKE